MVIYVYVELNLLKEFKKVIKNLMWINKFFNLIFWLINIIKKDMVKYI